MLSFNQVKQVHLEISTRCNATCPLCPRNLFGVDLVDDYPITDMTLEQAKKIFTPAFLNQLKTISINGNLGDFITARDGLAIVQYFKQTNPDIYIQISTNASGRPNIWAELGKLGVKVFFTIDGLADTHKLYRQYTNWDMIISNAKKFIEAGGDATWKMILFDHNEHQVEECRQLAAELGFTDFNLIDQGRSSGPVFTRERELSHILGTEQPKEPTEWTELKASKDWFKEQVKNNVVEFYKIKPIPRQIECKIKSIGEIYISATGDVYPCCWTGFYPGEMFHPGNEQIDELRHENNAIEFGVEHAMAWFNLVEERWHRDSYESGSLHTCNNTCGV